MMGDKKRGRKAIDAHKEMEMCVYGQQENSHLSDKRRKLAEEIVRGTEHIGWRVGGGYEMRLYSGKLMEYIYIYI